MSRLLTTLLALVSLSPALLAQNKRVSPPLVFTHITVIDGTGAPPAPDMSVVIIGGRITGLGKTGSVRVPKGARVVDATGKFLIPGLWDMHAHFWNDENLLRLFVANGVTGVRDMGGKLERVRRWRQQTSGGELIGPRIVAAGLPLDGAAFELPLLDLKPTVVTSAEGARAAVADLKKNGADFVKVLSEVPRDAYFSAAAEAKRQSMPLAGHVPNSITALEASDAGQKSMEHLFGIGLACSSEESSLRSAISEALAKQDWKTFTDLSNRTLDTYSEEKARALFSRFVKNGTYNVPSLTLLKRMGYLFADDPTHDPRLKYLPHSIKDKWENPNDAKKNLSARARDYYEREYQRSSYIVRAMQRSGVKLMAGTDTGDPYTYPGFTLHEELKLLVQAGLTPMEALQAATRNPAEYLGKLDSFGTVGRGKIADLVLLNANPLEDIGNVQHVHAVVFDGKYLSKTALEKILADVEAAATKR